MRVFLWLLSLGVPCLLALLRLGPGGPVETDILALLPEAGESPALAAATERSRDAFSRQLLALVRGPDEARTRAAAMLARTELADAGLQATVDEGETGRVLAVYREHGFALLSEAAVARYRSGGVAALATDLAVSLAGPGGMVSLGDDPGGHAGRFVASLPQAWPGFLPDGSLLAADRDGESLFLLAFQVPAAVFSGDGALRAAEAAAAARATVANACSECRFEATGAALFAAEARLEAHRETWTLSLVSTLLIMLLIALAYRSLAPHLLGFLQLGASVLVAAASVIAVFGSIHVLTLVFGTTLLGIAIDYAFLYFSEYWFGNSSPQAVLRKIGSGLGVGLLTGVLAFVFLALTGFPALMQMGVFSAAGLVQAALVVVLIFPLGLARRPAVAEHALVRWPRRFLAAARRPSRWRVILPLAALALAAPGWWQLRAHDEVRELSHFPAALLETDQAIRATLGQHPAAGFFLVEAPDLATALQREEALRARLAARLPDARMLGLSRFVPSPARQEASLATWAELLGEPQALADAFAATGLPAALAAHVVAGWERADRTPLAAAELFAQLPALERFVVSEAGGTALMATVLGEEEVPVAALAAAAADLPGVQLVEPLARIDAALAAIRVRAMWLVLAGYLLISAILVWRYRLREAVRMLYPPLLALALTLGILGWLGTPLNIFSVVALILILGLGRDYAVFLREVGAAERSTAMAVLLSALTTVIAFGLLAFSSTPALHAFGLATGIGILLSGLVTPLSLPAEAAGAQP